MSEVLEYNLDAVRSELREIQLEQHAGKWIWKGDPNDKAGLASHDEYVRARVNRGIELTAIDRGISAAPKPRGKPKPVSKESVQAALSEDLLS